MSAGCETGFYYFSFKDEGDLSNDEGAWGVVFTGFHEFSSEGVDLRGTWICASHRYQGDFSIVSQVQIDVGSDAFNLGFYLSPKPIVIGSVSEDIIAIVFECNVEKSVMTVAEEYGGGMLVMFEENIQWINTHGSNTIKISKSGNIITVAINDLEAFTWPLTYYEDSWFCPSIRANGAGVYWIRDFRLDYEGWQVRV